MAIARGAANSNRLYYSSLSNPLQPIIGAPVKPIFEEDGGAEVSAIRQLWPDALYANGPGPRP
jgi:hypothetical protein